MGFYNECPECNGGVLQPISDTEDRCLNCGYIKKSQQMQKHKSSGQSGVGK